MSLWFALLILQGSQAALGLVTSAVVPMSNAALAQQSVIRCRVPATCCYLRPYSRASRPAPTPGAACGKIPPLPRAGKGQLRGLPAS